MKNVACIPCSRSGSLAANWSTVPSSKPIVTMTVGERAIGLGSVAAVAVVVGYVHPATIRIRTTASMIVLLGLTFLVTAPPRFENATTQSSSARVQLPLRSGLRTPALNP
jgi:hypothetical protein